MANELSERRVYLDFAPASIDFVNYDELKAEVEKYAEKYKGLIFTRDEKQGAMQARSELKSLFDAIDEQRKTVKNKYNEPLNEFEKQIKTLTNIIDGPLSDIRDGLKVIEEAEKDERKEKLTQIIKEKTSETEYVSPEEVQIDSKWMNAGNWTAKLKPVKKMEDEIDFAIEQIEKEKRRKEFELKMLVEYCESQNIDPAGWIKQLDYRDAAEVIDEIKKEVERKRVEEEQRKAREEQEEQARIEREKQQELERLEQEKQSGVVRQEPIQDELPQEKFQTELEQPTIHTNVIRVSGTLEQLQRLNEFLVTSGIKVEEVSEEEKGEWDIDDLPF